MKKLLSIATGFVILFAVVASAGITDPILLTTGRIKNGSVQVITFDEYRRGGHQELYSVNNSEKDGGYTEEMGGYSGGFRIAPKHWANKPISEGAIPQAGDGLINSDKPVVMQAKGNTIAFNFDYYQNDGMIGMLQMRVFDERGHVLGTVTKKNNPANKPLVINVSAETNRYYLEVSDPTKKDYRSKDIIARYCYILVEVVKASSASLQTMPVDQKVAFAKLQEARKKYMTDHNIDSTSKLRVKDYTVIFDVVNKELGQKVFDVKYLQDPTDDDEEQKKENKPAPSKKSNSKTKRTKKSK